MGKVEKGFKKGKHFFETWGKDLENGFSQNLKGIKKGEGGCGSAVCIGLECLCKVFDLRPWSPLQLHFFRKIGWQEPLAIRMHACLKFCHELSFQES